VRAETQSKSPYTCQVIAPAVEVTDLVKRYGDRSAVDGLSLQVGVGEVFALLGPNGAGKTTTIEMCEGYRTPDAGSVRVLGLDPVADAAQLRPRVGLMLQDGIGGYTAARARELLALFASYAAHPHSVDDLLERVGLTEVAGVAVKRLSGGQKQRLSLAAALVGRPELVFLDEPTAGMDPQARRGTWELISQMRTDGVTVVLSTHYLEEAEFLADHVVVVDAGKVVAQGTPDELTRGGGDGQLRFSAVTGLDLDALAAALPDHARVIEVSAGHYLLDRAPDPALIAAITMWCANRNVLVSDISLQRRSLEDVFLDLTGREIRA
jgi:ABC-2 type transport system ATP-binding protein